MINKQRYIEEYLSKVKDIHPKLEHVFNLETIENYERSTGKAVGIIPNLPFNTIIMPLVKPRGTSDDKAFVYPHLMYPDGKGGAATLITVTDGMEDSTCYILFVHNQRLTADNMVYLEIPRGFKDFSDQNTIETALREISEETGIHVSSKEAIITKLGSMMPDSGLSNNTVDLYHISLTCNNIKDIELTTHDNTEGIVGYAWFSEEDVFQLLAENKIVDSFSLCALLKYMLTGLSKA